MSSVAVPGKVITLRTWRPPSHQRLQELRRRLVASIVKRLLPPDDNHVRQGALPRTGIQRVLVCRPNHRLGNTLLVTPLMAELERHFPGAEVDVLGAGDAASSVYRGYTTVGDIHLLDRRAIRHPLATIRTVLALRKKRYDLVIDAASGSSSGRIISAMVHARHQLSVDSVRSEVPAHMAARPVHALRWALGIDTELPIPTMDLRLSAPELACGHAALRRVLGVSGTDPGAPVVAIFPNATGAKQYGEAWWSAFLGELKALVKPLSIVELVAADGQSRVSNLYPTYFTSDPRKLAAFIDAAGLYISADCGVMHLASATTATTVGLFNTTDLRRYTPYGGMNVGFWTEGEVASAVARRVAEHLLRRTRHADQPAHH